MTIETEIVAVISTAHVDDEGRDWLDKQGEIAATYYRTSIAPALPIAADIYGWRIYCGDENEIAEAPQTVKTVLAWARNLGHQYVRLDRDGDNVEPALEAFDW